MLRQIRWIEDMVVAETREMNTALDEEGERNTDVLLTRPNDHNTKTRINTNTATLETREDRCMMKNDILGREGRVLIFRQDITASLGV